MPAPVRTAVLPGLEERRKVVIAWIASWRVRMLAGVGVRGEGKALGNGIRRGPGIEGVERVVGERMGKEWRKC